MTEHEDKPLVLIVDDTEANIDVLLEVLGEDYELSVAMNGQDALDAVAETPPDLVLLDIMMPEMDGYEVCRRLKAEPASAKIPVIFVTAMSEVSDEAKGFETGAVDYITKPISPPVVLARIKTHLALADQQRACEKMLERQLAEIRQGQKDAIYMLGQAGHYNDDDEGVHIWRMASYSRALAKAAGWPVKKQKTLLLAAPLHDTGKIGIPDSVLKKGEKLSEDEWNTLRQHPVIGHKILSVGRSPVFRMAADIALNHHERWGGGGYPRGLVGTAIPESARIVAIADVFDALTMNRPSKDPWPFSRALEYIINSQGQFETRLAELFVSIHDELEQIKKFWLKKEKTAMLVDDV